MSLPPKGAKVTAVPACHNCAHAGPSKVLAGPPPIPAVRCRRAKHLSAEFGHAAEWKSPSGFCPLHEFATEGKP